MLQFPAVKLTFQQKLGLLMAVHVLWGIVLWFSISKYGLGVSTDSVHILFGARNLAEGRGLISYDGSFLALWPPLYPALLALIHVVAGLDMLGAAAGLHAAAFLGLSLCLSLLFMRIFHENFLLALTANVLADIGPVVLISFDVVGSDYVELLLVVLCVLLTGLYIESKSPRTYVALAMVGMLAVLERYLGIAAVATAAAAVFVLADDRVGTRLLRSSFLCVAAAPAGVWLAITSQLYTRRAPISLAENFNWFSKSVLEWFFPAKVLKPHLEVDRALLWIVMAGLIVLVVVASRRRATPNEGVQEAEGGLRLRDLRPGLAQNDIQGDMAPLFALPLLMSGLFYALALFGSASVAYFNKLGGRFLLPLYIPIVTLLVAGIGGAMPRPGARHSTARRLAAPVLGASVVMLVAGLLLQVTLPLAYASHAEGAAGGENAFNTRQWNRNQALQYWRSHEPRAPYLLFSNQPDGVTFQTEHATLSSPRKASGPYGTVNYPLSDYVPELFSSGQDGYLLWIEAGAADYYYTVDDLAAIAEIGPLFVSEDGGLYRLRPKPTLRDQ